MAFTQRLAQRYLETTTATGFIGCMAGTMMGVAYCEPLTPGEAFIRGSAGAFAGLAAGTFYPLTLPAVCVYAYRRWKCPSPRRRSKFD